MRAVDQTCRIFGVWRADRKATAEPPMRPVRSGRPGASRMQTPESRARQAAFSRVSEVDANSSPSWNAVLRPARAATGSKEARVAESAKAISEATSGTSEPLLCSETAIREAPALDR